VTHLTDNDIVDRHTERDCWEGFKKYTVQIGSGAMIHPPGWFSPTKFIKSYSHTRRDHENRIKMLLFSMMGGHAKSKGNVNLDQCKILSSLSSNPTNIW
jgi:hypothetical protein